jgi:hypothetical protein
LRETAPCFSSHPLSLVPLGLNRGAWLIPLRWSYPGPMGGNPGPCRGTTKSWFPSAGPIQGLWGGIQVLAVVPPSPGYPPLVLSRAYGGESRFLPCYPTPPVAFPPRHGRSTRSCQHKYRRRCGKLCHALSPCFFSEKPPQVPDFQFIHLSHFCNLGGRGSPAYPLT